MDSIEINCTIKISPKAESSGIKVQTEDDLKKEIEKLKCINQALTEQNVRLHKRGAILKHELESEKFYTQKYSERLEKGILSDVIDLIQNDDAKDFSVVINNSEYPVHKFILEARSPTLADILKNNPEAKNVVLTDVSEEVFEEILHFLYTDILPRENGTDYIQLFIAAGILKIQDLKFFAGVKSCNYINKENVLDLFLLSVQYDHDVLQNCAFDEMKKYYPSIKFERSWRNDVNAVLEAFNQYEKKRVSKIPVRVSYL